MRSFNDIYVETTPIEYDDELEVNLLCLYADYEPLSFKEANKSECWRTAMKEEIRALKKNDTWVLTSLPPQQKAIEVKWVFKIKRAANGTIDRYKVRLVAKGYG